MPTYSLSQLINAAAGTKPWIKYWKSLAEHVNDNAADISALSVGSTPGWDAAVDRRWWITLTGTNTYSGTAQQAATGSDTISTGQFFMVDFANRNTSTTCTLNLGSSEAAEDIKCFDNGVVRDPYEGELNGYTNE